MKKLIPCLLVLWLITLGCNASALPFLATPEPTATPTPAYTPTPPPTPTPLPSPTPQPIARVDQGDQALFVGDYERAAQAYQSALDNGGDEKTQAAALTGLGRTAILQNNCNSAVGYLNAAIQRSAQDAHNASAYYFLGQCLEGMTRYVEAANAYATYIQLRPGVLDTFMNTLRADALRQGGDLNGALAAYQLALQTATAAEQTEIQIKIGKTYSAQSDFNNAIRTFMSVYDASSNDYTKAQMDLLAGQTYLAMGLPEQAYARFQDAVNNYPRSYDSYSGLVALVNAGVPVNELNRGLADYFANQYGLAVDAFNRYLKSTPDHDGTVHHYKALSLRALEKHEDAIIEWDALIKDHPGDRFWVTAWEEKADTQWIYLNQYKQAAETLLLFGGQAPNDPEAPNLLYKAARILERDGRLLEAAAIWEQLIDKYPGAELSYRGLFLAGLSYYRAGKLPEALTTFQRALVLATTPTDQASAYFWVARTQQAQNDTAAARASLEQAALRDPTGYYSERARTLLAGQALLTATNTYDLAYDLNAERPQAEEWLRQTFNLPPESNLGQLGSLAAEPRFVRGNALWELGRYGEASLEFEAMLKTLEQDPAASFRLLPYLLEKGFYRGAILASRQILARAGMDDAATLSAPPYFNHIRFGVYYKDIILEAAQSEKIHPLLLLSIIRQESLFEGHVESPAGARGLMQIMPATGQDIANSMSWPYNYSDQDLYRPMVNVKLGARYMARQRDYFGDPYVALAAYNGGPGNAQGWKDLANGDPDLFLEVIRFDETRRYIQHISEFLAIYRILYERNP